MGRAVWIAGEVSSNRQGLSICLLGSPGKPITTNGVKKMWQRFGRQTPATIVALVAVVVALAGSAYAAGRIDGRAVRVKSLPGNRLKPRSVPANRLKPGVIPAATGISGQI